MANLTTTDLDNGKTDLETLSTVVNSQTESTTSTRLGDTVRTLKGLQDEYEQEISDGVDEFNTAISNAEAEAETVINNITYSVGFNIVGDFAIGVTVSNSNDVLKYQNGLYRTTESLPYTTDGATPDADSGEWVSVAEGELSNIARSLNALDSQVIYATDTATVLDGILYIYDSIAQATWLKPSTVTAGSTIVSVSGSTLTATNGDYELLSATPFNNESGVVTFRKSATRSAVENMILGSVSGVDGVITLEVGKSYSTGLTTWTCNSVTPVDISDFTADGWVYINDYIVDNSLNVTSEVQSAIDSHLHIDWCEGGFIVDKVTLGTRGASYRGDAYFIADSDTETGGVVELVERNLNIDSLQIDQSFKDNYEGALKWHSLSSESPAQFNKIKSLKTENCIQGVLFGQLEGGDPVIDAAQSENTITHFSTRGCQIPVFMNQSNGFLSINSGNLVSANNEWEDNNPGIYSYTNSRCAKVVQGTLQLNGGEVIKADTQLGLGFEINGGQITLSSITSEIASKFLKLSNDGTFSATNIINLFSNSSDDMIELNANATGLLQISNSQMNKSDGAINASTAFLLHNSAEVDVQLSNISLGNQLNFTAFKNENGVSTISKNSQIENLIIKEGRSGEQDVRIGSNSKSGDVLKTSGVDTFCRSTDGWYLTNVYGGGTSINVSSDAPSGEVKTYTNSIEVIAGGEAWATTMDISSLAQVQATGLAVIEGQILLISGYVKATTEGSQQYFGLSTADSAGTRGSFIQVQGTVDVTGEWRYFEDTVIIPSGVTYVGVGVAGVTSTVLVCDPTCIFIN